MEQFGSKLGLSAGSNPALSSPWDARLKISDGLMYVRPVGIRLQGFIVNEREMKILLLNTVHGLVPLYDDDYEEKKKLVIGKEYKAEIRQARNVLFHRKYFGMLDAAWSLLKENQRRFFGGATYGESFGKEAFRRSVQISAGFFEPIWDVKGRCWQKSVKSIAFDKMDEGEFENLYKAVYDTVMDLLSMNGTSQQDFDRMIDNFQ